ncbi:YggS family pyridoxal phosphate-dependent enzyme [Gelidibacter sp. DF109]|uniref:Pyridoxal phosphate homeostasis protein n=2 Tax=Gelidibacter pelagius TaxID=2819985 RepID=A0ABS3SS62_9FLAO|nr:YggS family pyridoxal phosphate-dependent enzyme [Gelidibacter pelagius]
MNIQENLNHIKSTLPKHVTLVAVTKTKSIDEIMEAYNAGHRIFGENKIQEMVEKEAQLPKDIEWHMIGNVQRNKVKHMAPFVNLIHGVDSLRLLKEIDKQAKRHERTINCLLQIKIAEEDSKFGMSSKDAQDILQSSEISELKNVCIVGVMGMATFTDDQNQIEEEFKKLKSTFDELKALNIENCKLKTISMGMSGDYEMAINCGSNMVRVGSSIFGERNY